MIRKRMISIAALSALVLAASALAGSGDRRQVGGVLLTTSQPNASSGLDFAVDYRNPDDPQAKPPAVRKVVSMLPKHARYDTRAPGLCRASDAELIALGAAACPANSKLTDGVITVDTGVPGPGRFIISDTTFLNNEDELIYVNTARDTDARVIVRAEVRRRRIITESPPLPGAPPDGAAIDTVSVHFPAISSARGNYITTPRRCPPRGYWVTKIRFRYADGVRQVERDRNPCRGGR